MSRSGPEKIYIGVQHVQYNIIVLRHLYITAFALRCADSTEKVLGSIEYICTENCRKLKQMAFFTKKNGG